MGPSNRNCNMQTLDHLRTLGVLCVVDKSNTVLAHVQKLLASQEANKLLTELKAIDLGIVPSGDTEEIRSYLSSVSLEEATKLKRKFRKLQRKYRKKSNLDYDTTLFGAKDIAPNKFQKSARKNLVFSSIMMEITD